MFLSIIFALYFWIYLVLSISLQIIAGFFWLIRFRKGRDFIVMLAAKIWARCIFGISRQRVEVIGIDKLPEHDNLCFISNHQSYADIPLLFAQIPKKIGFIAKSELRKVPVLNVWMILLNCAFIKRNDLRKSVKKIEERIKKIAQGYPMVIFPEGTRAQDGKMKPFKAGSIVMVARHGITIVPVTIDGMYRGYELRHRITPAYTRLIIHPPIETGNLSKDETKALPSQIEEKIRQSIINSGND